jgi:hypothetical protein
MEVTQDTKIKYIIDNIDNIIYLNDDDISKLYNKFIYISPQKTASNKISKSNDNRKVKKSTDNTNNLKVSENENTIISKQNNNPQKIVRVSKNNTTIKVPKKSVNGVSKIIDSDNESSDVSVDDTLEEEKCELLLKYVNGILKNAGKDEITKLTDFISIDRVDIIKDVNIQFVNNMTDELFEVFDKKKCKFYPKVKGLPLTLLRNLLKNTQTYILDRQGKEVYEGRARRATTLYTILNKKKILSR